MATWNPGRVQILRYKGKHKQPCFECGNTAFYQWEKYLRAPRHSSPNETDFISLKSVAFYCADCFFSLGLAYIYKIYVPWGETEICWAEDVLYTQECLREEQD